MALLLYVLVGFLFYRLLGCIALFSSHEYLVDLLIHRTEAANQTQVSLILPMNGNLSGHGKSMKIWKKWIQLCANLLWKCPHKYKEKVSTLVWPLHTGQISRDISRTSMSLAQQMKMKTRMMDVNRIHQSTCHRSFPLKEKQGIWHLHGGCHGNVAIQSKCSWWLILLNAGKYQCNQVFELLLTHVVQRLPYKWGQCLKQALSLLSCLDEFK